MDSVSRDQFSQDQLPPDQLSRDQIATRSTFTRSTCHQVNSHKINLPRDQLNFECWSKDYYEHSNVSDHVEVFDVVELQLTRIPAYQHSGVLRHGWKTKVGVFHNFLSA